VGFCYLRLSIYPPSTPKFFANRLLFRIPTSGGQYYWVAVLAPRPYRRYLSFITGKLFSSLQPHLLSVLLGYSKNRMALRTHMADWSRW
jgi:hypothetical protein